MRDVVGKILVGWRTRMARRLVEGRLLDLACGMNRLVRSYDGAGVGVDVYQWGDVDRIIDDAARLPFEDAAFDTVTIIAALNHIPNRKEALNEVHRILRPDGRLLVTMISPLVGLVWHKLRAPWDADQVERGMVEGELYGMHRRHVCQLMEETGFAIEGHRRFMLGFNTLTIARRSAPTLTPTHT